MSDIEKNRRPVQARSAGWARRIASHLAATNITPNQISVASIFFALIGAVLLICKPDVVGFIGAAVAIQARLICNLLDGMVAVEGGKQSPLGQIYNEFPDRIADSLLIVAAGYAIGIPSLGWFGALAAALTAYIRVFGGSLGLQQNFMGPMAKQHRMAVITIGCLLSALEQPINGSLYALTTALAIVGIGSAITCITRTRAIARQLQSA
jgi:CDP-diacylglycerol--glycerol-3-phosphate 3-phosphatidyltransferase